MPGRAVAVATLAAATLVGCGVGADREQARAVVDRFSAAIASGDGRGACRELTPELVASLESQAGEACAAAVTRLDLDPAAPVAADVFATSAVVRLAGGELAYLDRNSSGWRLSAVGCRPDDAKPADRPADCAAEA